MLIIDNDKTLVTELILILELSHLIVRVTIKRVKPRCYFNQTSKLKYIWKLMAYNSVLIKYNQNCESNKNDTQSAQIIVSLELPPLIVFGQGLSQVVYGNCVKVYENRFISWWIVTLTWTDRWTGGQTNVPPTKLFACRGYNNYTCSLKWITLKRKYLCN